jgi:hypothetical protein
MNHSRSLAVAVSFVTSTLVVLSACTRTSVPIPVVHDTVTVVRHDTTVNIDTLYGTPDPSINMKNGLVLYLPFNGSFADSSGSGNTITAVGGATLDYDMHGYASSAFNATGAGERLIVGNNGAYKVDTAFTVSCDFMLRSNAYYSGGYDFSGLQVFLSIVNVAAGTGPTFNIGMSVPAFPQYFTFNVCGAQGNDCSSYGANMAYNISDTSNFIPQLGAWYNVVCVFNKNITSIYVNGKLTSTQTNPNTASALFCTGSNFVVGGWWNGGNSGTENLRGKLDEVRFYNRPLNSHEIGWLARNFQPTSVRQAPGAQTGSGSRLH